MIYTFGSSLTKYYWPTWADWLGVYQGAVTNLSYTGYDNQIVYYNILNQIDDITKDDTVYVMWPSNTTMSIWYDDAWIEKNNCRGFFPNQEGKLVFSDQTPWMGMYKQHPDHLCSFTHFLIQNLQSIFNSQLLLDRIGCQYTMMFNINPWIDVRPSYNGNVYTTIWDTIIDINEDSVDHARQLLTIQPIKQLVDKINWDRCIGIPDDLTDLKNYSGILEYDFANKEYVVLKNTNDVHPTPLAHHDYLLEKILGRDPKSGMYRDRAIEISKQAMQLVVPKFSVEDHTATPNTPMLLIDV